MLKDRVSQTSPCTRAQDVEVSCLNAQASKRPSKAIVGVFIFDYLDCKSTLVLRCEANFL